MAAYGDSEYIGSIDIWPGSFYPVDYLFCLGQYLPISQYQALFAVILYYYGRSGNNLFALPNLQGRVPVGSGLNPQIDSEAFVIGEMGGSDIERLSLYNMPEHSHDASFIPAGGKDISAVVSLPVQAGLGTGTNNPVGNYLGSSGSANIYYDDQTSGKTLAPVDLQIYGSLGAGIVNVNKTGNQQVFDIRQPYLALNYIICCFGVYPTKPE